MKAFITWLNENPYWIFIVAALGLGTGLFGIVTYYKSNRKKELSVRFQTFNMIENFQSSVSGLEITYEGKPTETLGITTIQVRNTGNLGIDEGDMWEPIKLSVEANEIFSITLSESSAEKPNKFMISRDHNDITLAFGYMSPGDCATIQIIHGDLSGKIAIKADGKVKDGTVKIGEQDWKKTIDRVENFSNYFTKIILALPLTVFGIFYTSAANSKEQIILSSLIWATLLIVVFWRALAAGIIGLIARLARRIAGIK